MKNARQAGKRGKSRLVTESIVITRSASRRTTIFIYEERRVWLRETKIGTSRTDMLIRKVHTRNRDSA